VVSSLATIYLATANPSYAVEKDYYQKGLRWDERIAQDRRNQVLGWEIVFDVSPPSAFGDRPKLSVTLTDRDGDRMSYASISVEAFHNARSNDILEATLASDSKDVYSAQLPMRRSGVWEFRFRVERADNVFTHVVRRHLILDRD
jgi:nitrogen fixation protein FixH